MDEKIKVTDKRMFTADGEVRSDAPEPENSDEQNTTGESQSSARDDSPAEPPQGSEQSRPPEGEFPEPTFIDLVGLLAQPIALYLGDAVLPGGEAEENLPLARFHIDLLDIVKSKTAGNISAEEDKLLEDLLYQLRMRYVEKAG